MIQIQVPLIEQELLLPKLFPKLDPILGPQRQSRSSSVRYLLRHDCVRTNPILNSNEYPNCIQKIQHWWREPQDYIAW